MPVIAYLMDSSFRFWLRWQKREEENSKWNETFHLVLHWKREKKFQLQTEHLSVVIKNILTALCSFYPTFTIGKKHERKESKKSQRRKKISQKKFNGNFPFPIS